MTGMDNFRGGVVAVLVAFALVVTGSEATAQGRVELSAYGVLGDVPQDAAQTFKPVPETSHARVFGGGVRVTNLRIQPLGIPLKVRMLYFDVADGWRHAPGRLSANLGGGFSRLRYPETSEFAQQGDAVADRGTGPQFLAGVDLDLPRWVRVGGELRYRRIGGVLGWGGALASVVEGSAGGVSTAIRVSMGH
jgi:hypothetical protein